MTDLFTVLRYRWKLTCKSCPEQYNVYAVDLTTEDQRQVAYFRLRYGALTVRCPDANGEVVYNPGTDVGYGEFSSGELRGYYLGQIEQYITSWLTRQRAGGRAGGSEAEVMADDNGYYKP